MELDYIVFLNFVILNDYLFIDTPLNYLMIMRVKKIKKNEKGDSGLTGIVS